ncbi:hypothetical protein SUGI_0890260 [Cryptomeria japonica]|nr:hypothetical protein SUGI_0890260 [Cryptomeria japonica]
MAQSSVFQKGVMSMEDARGVFADKPFQALGQEHLAECMTIEGSYYLWYSVEILIGMESMVIMPLVVCEGLNSSSLVDLAPQCMLPVINGSFVYFIASYNSCRVVSK